MHEHGEADRLMRRALAIAEEMGLSKITKIVIGIGDLTGMFQEPLKEELIHVAGHHGLTGIEFEFFKIKPEAFCRECQKTIGQESRCPFCGGGNIEIISGLDNTIQEVS